MFRFSIRELILILPLLAVCFAWVCEHGRLKATQENVDKLQAELRDQHAQFEVRETALRAKFAPPRTRRCGVGIMIVPDCWDPSGGQEPYWFGYRTADASARGSTIRKWMDDTP